MTVLVKGTHVWFVTDTGGKVRMPTSYGMCHDPEGTDRARCEVFFCAFRRTGKVAELTRKARNYLGPDYVGHVTKIDVPRDGWHEVARVKTIRYRRWGDVGIRSANEEFRHEFRSAPLPLSKSGRCYRIELGAVFCLLDDRGFIFP